MYELSILIFLCFAFDLLFTSVTVEESSTLGDGQNNSRIITTMFSAFACCGVRG